jgi:transglutaminase-like putative cysteine protease
LTVICDPGIKVDVKMFNVADSLITRSVTKEKGRSVQRFTMKNVPALRYEPNAPSYYYYAPHAQLVVTMPGDKDTGDSTTDLYAWYTEHIQKAFEPAPASIQALADSLTAGISDDQERAATIYRWVQDKIQYVAIEDGMNGFIPAGPAEVCNARYGDCKGMSSLLRALLRSAGLDAHLAWVGTRKLPYTYSDLPTTVNSDHMIVALDIADTTLFLDATSNQAAFGVPSGFIQGKEALIGVDPEHHRIQMVPIMPASYSTLRDSVRGRLDGNTFVGSGSVRYTGYHRQQITDIMRNYPLDKRMLIMRSVLMKGSNTFQLDSISVNGLDDREGPLDVHYTFRIPDLARAVGGKRYVPLTLSDPWEDLRVHVDRKLPIDISFLSTEAYQVTMEVPADTRCTGLPARFTSTNEGFDADIAYVQAPGTVTSESVFRTNTLLIKKELDAWRTLNTAYLKERGRSLVLENP